MQSGKFDDRQIHEIAEEITRKASKNASAAEQLIFPHVYLVLRNHLSSVGLAPSADQDALQALRVARSALNDTVQVMERDLEGLRLIQPELRKAKEALATIDVTFAKLAIVQQS